jgi:hypothetical protein
VTEGGKSEKKRSVCTILYGEGKDSVDLEEIKTGEKDVIEQDFFKQ